MRILEVNYCFLPEPARRPRTEWLWSQWPHLDNLTMAGRQAKVLNWQVGGLQVLLSYVKLKKRQVSVKQKLWKFHQFDKFDNLGAFLWKSATSGQRCIDSRLAISDLLQLDVQKITTEFWPSNKKIWKKSLLLCISMFCRLHFKDSIFLASLDFPEIAGVLFFFPSNTATFWGFWWCHPCWNTQSCLKHSSLHHGSSKKLQVEVKGSILLVDIALRFVVGTRWGPRCFPFCRLCWYLVSTPLVFLTVKVRVGMSYGRYQRKKSTTYMERIAGNKTVRNRHGSLISSCSNLANSPPRSFLFARLRLAAIATRKCQIRGC